MGQPSSAPSTRRSLGRALSNSRRSSCGRESSPRKSWYSGTLATQRQRDTHTEFRRALKCPLALCSKLVLWNCGDTETDRHTRRVPPRAELPLALYSATERGTGLRGWLLCVAGCRVWPAVFGGSAQGQPAQHTRAASTERERERKARTEETERREARCWRFARWRGRSCRVASGPDGEEGPDT